MTAAADLGRRPGANRLGGKVALVFGAGSSGPGWGNGKAAAVAYAREGAAVIAVDSRRDAAEETAGIIMDEGGTCTALAADATISAEILAAVEQSVAAHGRIDVLHNNVGAPMIGGPVELSEQDWGRQLEINLKPAFLACKHALPVMLRQGGGAIVNISSLAAIRFTGYLYSGYYAAKAGLNQFTIALAMQYAAQGIRVNAIMPGLMDTPLIHRQIAGQYADHETMLRARHAAAPMGRMGTAWDVAYAAVFLASDEAQYITGVCLPVDGGISCRC